MADFEAAPSKAGLSPAQKEHYRREGYVAPVAGLSPEEAAAVRSRMAETEQRNGGALKGAMRHKPHLLFPWAAELIRHPKVLDAVEDVLGPNLLCWSSTFFIKEANDPSFVSWHQDLTYWGLSAPDIVTAWIALSDSSVDNGAMRVIPGTHTTEQLPHRDTFDPKNLLTRGQEIAVEVDENEAVALVLQPGEFSLHDVKLVHGSEPNPSSRRRIGYAVRYIPTYVYQTAGERDSATLVRGVDREGHFEPEPMPLSDMHPDAVAFHQATTERQAGVLMRGTGKQGFRA